MNEQRYTVHYTREDHFFGGTITTQIPGVYDRAKAKELVNALRARPENLDAHFQEYVARRAR